MAFRAVERCRLYAEKIVQHKTAFNSLENLATGQFLDPEMLRAGRIAYVGFRYDVARILRYQKAIEYLVGHCNPALGPFYMLEIGAGRTDPVKMLLQLGGRFPELSLDVVDLDTSEICIEDNRVTIHEYDVTSEAFRKWAEEGRGCYRAITMFETIEHLYPNAVPTVLVTLYDLLAPGGVLFISSPNPHVEEPKDWPGHRRHYDLAELCYMLTTAGFSVDISEAYSNRAPVTIGADMATVLRTEGDSTPQTAAITVVIARKM